MLVQNLHRATVGVCTWLSLKILRFIDRAPLVDKRTKEICAEFSFAAAEFCRGTQRHYY